MHYRVYVDSELVHDSTFPEKEWKLINPSLEMSANEQGSFTFVVPPYHVKYSNGVDVRTDLFKKRGAIVRINVVDKEGNEGWFWEGEIIDDQFDYHNNRHISCDGALGYLNSVKSTPTVYYIYTKPTEAADSAIRNCINRLLIEYNRAIDATGFGNDNRKVYVGEIVGFDRNDIELTYEQNEENISGDGFFYFTSAFDSFWTIIENRFIQKIGGYLNIRRDENDDLRLDYFKFPYSLPRTNTHVVNFFRNLIDLNKDETTEDLFTVLIPRGRTISKGDPYYINSLGENTTQRLLYGYYGVLKRSKYYYAYKDNAGRNNYFVPANTNQTAPDITSSNYLNLQNEKAFRCRLRKDDEYYYAYYVKVNNKSYYELTSFMDAYDYVKMTKKCRFTLQRMFNDESKKIYFNPTDGDLFDEFYKTFGYIEKVVDFDNAITETQLLEKAYSYLYDKVVKTWFERFKKSNSIETVDLTFSFVELDDDVPIRLYDKVLLDSEVHGVHDVTRGVTSISIVLDSPEKSQVGLESEKKNDDMTSI